MHKRFAFVFGFMLAGLALGQVGAARADTLYYTTYANEGVSGDRVWSLNYNWSGGSPNLTSLNTPVANTTGSDGILFAPNGNLLIAGQSQNQVYEVTTSGAAVASQSTASVGSYHLALAPGGLLYSVNNGGCGSTCIAAIQLAGGGLTGSSPGTAYTVSGPTNASLDLRGVIFDPTNNTWYYGTSTDGNSLGDFGTISFDNTNHTANLNPIYSVNAGTGAAHAGTGVYAHGLTYDPFTQDIFFSTGEYLSQYDPSNGNLVTINSGVSGNAFDQSAVTGNGQIFLASNDGNIAWLDYSNAVGHSISGLTLNEQFLISSLDDVAPLAGIGSQNVPEPGSLALFGAALGGLICFRRRQRARLA